MAGFKVTTDVLASNGSLNPNRLNGIVRCLIPQEEQTDPAPEHFIRLSTLERAHEYRMQTMGCVLPE